MAAAHVNLGAAFLAKRDYASAVGPLRRALEINASLPGAHGMLGTALLAQGFACEAISHLEKGQAEDLLGVALLDCGRPREALERLEAALEKRPQDPDLLYYLSQTHGQLAKAVFEKLQQLDPRSPRAQQMLGEAQAAAGNRSAAQKHFAAALAARPDLRGIHFALGELALRAGEFETALSEFRTEADLAPGSALTAYKMGYAAGQLGKLPEAIAELRRADKLQPGMPETLFELGKLLHASGESQAAEEPLRRVLAAETDSELAEQAQFQLAQVYRALGRIAEAERATKAFQSLRSKRQGAPR
jgi:tetratricopeptide (TPR) repeat protein